MFLDSLIGEKGNEAANVTGPNGEPVVGSIYAAEKRAPTRSNFVQGAPTYQGRAPGAFQPNYDAGAGRGGYPRQPYANRPNTNYYQNNAAPNNGAEAAPYNPRYPPRNQGGYENRYQNRSGENESLYPPRNNFDGRPAYAKGAGAGAYQQPAPRYQRGAPANVYPNPQFAQAAPINYRPPPVGVPGGGYRRNNMVPGDNTNGPRQGYVNTRGGMGPRPPRHNNYRGAGNNQYSLNLRVSRLLASLLVPSFSVVPLDL